MTAIGHAKYRHRLYRVGRDKARQSKFYHLSPYAYCAGDPVNLVDPDGRLPILPIIWGIYELGAAIYDIYNAFDILSNEDSTTGEKLYTTGGLVLSAIFPGGGYTSLNKVDDIVKIADDAVGTGKAINKADDAVDAVKAVHSNSKKSEKAQHIYQIRNVENGEVVKVGISSGKISKDGKSYRATRQVNKWNKEIGADIFDSEIIEYIPEGKNARVTALKKEDDHATFLRSIGELNYSKYHKYP